MTPRQRNIALFVVLAMSGISFFTTAVRQKSALNLSATAGGQYPYLAYAQGMADEGVTKFFGDRNRMPLVPSIVSLAHVDDWNRFADRASWYAIGIAALTLVGVAAIAYHLLSVWIATAFVLIATFHIFLPTASFVQAELPYYGLFLLTWIIFCRVLAKPTATWGAVGGVACGLTYLTKASALPLLVLFALVQGGVFVVSLLRKPRIARVSGNADRSTGSKRLLSVVAALLGFMLLTGPYLQQNKQRFDRYFYNVNSTFFMWCDSWAQAEEFAAKYEIDKQFPQAAPNQIPSPVNYLHNHSIAQILHRLGYGLRTLGVMALHTPVVKYLGLIGIFAVFCLLKTRGANPRGLPTSRDFIPPAARKTEIEITPAVIAFSILALVGYLLAYAWYVPVAFGDRFILSLVLPLLFGGFWLLDRSSLSMSCCGRSIKARDALATVVIVGIGIELIEIIPTRVVTPTPEFVQFYYNESRARQDAGNFTEAQRGYRGVTKLDPSFALAHLSLGMIALMHGDAAGAIEPLENAVRFAPESADAHNSFGSALIQLDNTREAIIEFRQAITLKPEFASAWYNLGGSYVRAGDFARGKEVVERLRSLDSNLAARLMEQITRDQPPTP